jgi:outer membrane cobalamin receptor
VRIQSVVHAFDRERGVTGLSVIPAEAARAEVRRLLAGVSTRAPCARDERCVVETATSYLGARTTFSDPAFELAALRTSNFHNRGDRLSEQVGVRYAMTPDLDVAASLVTGLELLAVDRVGNLPRRAQRRSARPLASARFRPADPLLLHGLFALECHGTRGQSERFGSIETASSGACGVFEPVFRLGTAYALTSELSLLGNVSRSVRVPTLSELYGSSAQVDGNPLLGAERALGADLGLRLADPASATEAVAVSLDGFVFARRVDDLIQFRRSSSNTVAPYNVSSARILGAEAAIGLDAFRHLSMELSGTLLDPRETTADPLLDPSQNDILPFNSRLTLSSLVELYHAPVSGALRRAALTLRYYHRGSRYDDSAGQIVLPEQHRFDLEGSGSFFEDRLKLRASVQNLFDQLATDILGLPTPGRSYHLALEAWL